MAPIELEGDTLGQKQRSFNAHVKAATADESYKLSKINHDCYNVKNLMKIDVACIRRKAEYILEVLKCTDMLYVTRALRGSTWLVTDPQYAHIINPEYLNEELFARMTTRAKNKMLTTVRNNLKDSARAEAFFVYYKDNMSIAQAQLWLRHCSIDFIEGIVEQYADELSFNVLKHICRKSLKIFKTYLRRIDIESKFMLTGLFGAEKDGDIDDLIDILKLIKFLHKYLFVAEKDDDVIVILNLIYSATQRAPNFGKRFTRTLMKRYPKVIIANFEKYYYALHLSTFAKYIKKEDIEIFLIRQIQRRFMNDFCRYENLKHFLRYIPESRRVPLIKTILSGKEKSERPSSLINLKGTLGLYAYEFTSFDHAFNALKQILSIESSQVKRNSILSILIHSSRRNAQHMQTLLKYYRLHHMDDSCEDKSLFLKKVLVPSSIHKYDKLNWSIINEISLRINLNTDTVVPQCLETLIVYKILYGKHIPEAYVKKIHFRSFLSCRNQLSASEQDKVLYYLLNTCFKNIYKKEVGNEAEMRVMVDLITNVLLLLREWNKSPDFYPSVNDCIRDMLKMKIKNDWNIDLSSLYQANKFFRKDLFDESLLLYPSDVTAVNALKHKPYLLLLYREKLVATVQLERLLSKIRIYWPKSTVQQWVDIYLDCLKNPRVDKAIAVKSLCILLPRQEALTILVQKYAPDKSENLNDDEVATGKYIARYMHLIRPLVDEETLTLYANKEYLPYLLPSFDAIVQNQSCRELWNIILTLLDKDPLHRKAARLALSLLKNNEAEGYESVKIQLIKKLETLLYQEKDPAAALDIWNLFSKVFDDLTVKQKMSVAHFHHYLSNAHKVVINKIFVKIYSFLKLQYNKNTSDSMLLNCVRNIFGFLDLDIIENVVLKVVCEQVTKPKFGDGEEILSMYLLFSKCEKTQMQRYENIFVPIMDHYFACWQDYDRPDSCYETRFEKHRFYTILDILANICYKSMTEFKSIVPVKLFTTIRDKLMNTLNVEEDFKLIMTWNLNVIFVTILNDHLDDVEMITVDDDYIVNNESWHKICLSFVDSFGQASLGYLMPLLLESSLHHIYVSRVCVEVFSCFCIEKHFKLQFVKYLLSNVGDQVIFFVAIDILRCMAFDEDEANLIALYTELIRIIHSQESIEIRCYYNHYADVLLIDKMLPFATFL